MDKSILDFIVNLGNRGVSVRALNGQLKITGALSSLKEEDKERLRAFKPDILELLGQEVEATADHFQHILPADNCHAYPLSSSQKRLWVLGQLPETSIAYHIPATFIFRGKLDIPFLTECFRIIVNRHEILRTTFREDGSAEVKQFIFSPDTVHLRVKYHDVRNEINAGPLTNDLIMKEFSAPFDLSAWPLIRTGVFHIADDKWVFYCILHHIVSDAWSMRILMNEMTGLYRSLVANIPPMLPRLRIQYKDYAQWQQQQLQGGILEKSRQYWLLQMEGELPLLELPVSRPRPKIKTFGGDAVDTVLDKRLAGKLKSFVAEKETTLFMGLLAGVAAVLFRYTGQHDMIIGTPVAGRSHVDLEDQIGCYINTLPLRIRLEEKDSFYDLLNSTRQTTLGAFEHQAYPLDMLLDDLQFQRDTSRNPLFDVMMVLQNNEEYQEGAAASINGLEIDSYQGETYAMSKFDLTFYFHETTDGISLKVEYNTALFDRDIVHNMAGHFTHLLSNLLEEPQAPMVQVPYLPEKEQRLLAAFNNTAQPFPDDKTIIDLFEEQVGVSPDRTALVAGEKSLSFRELNEYANRLSNYLQHIYHIGSDDIIGIRLESSEWMIISILSALKTGAAYLPIDPSFPQSRIDFLVADSGCRLVIDTDVVASFRGCQESYSPENPVIVRDPLDLIYVIYTSGSTGKPKGCMLEHRSVVNRIYWMWNHYGFSTDDNILQKTAFTFDVSVWEIFMPLCFGARMVLCKREDSVSPDSILSLIEKEKITVLHFVPTMMNAFIARLFYQEDIAYRLKSMRLVIVSGEALLPATVRNWYAKVNIPVHNLYGPTEAAVDVTYYATSADDVVIPIGRPIWNTRMYVLDKYRALVPPGVYGEICIGGIGLARGYLNRPELSAEKFIAHPFNAGERLYCTGDTGRWLSNGDIEFSGRIDDQVKVRGYRIETGEIEHALRKHAGVADAHVKVWTDSNGNKELIAYLAGESHNEREIRAGLEMELPVYMIPHHFISLAAFPLTINGKIDRNALPAPDASISATNTVFTAGRNDKEIQLIAVYEDVLKKRPIGIYDDFFLLGGDSIKSIQIVSRMKQRGYVLTIQDVMRYPVIAGLSAHVKTLEREAEQELVTGVIPLAPIQHWFLDNSVTDVHHFNQSVLLESKQPLSVPGIRAVLEKITLHHDALRMIFHKTAAGWIQECRGEEQEVQLEVIPWTDETTFAKECNRVQSAADLSKGPLFRAVLFHDQEKDLLLLVAHHLVIDAVSWRILLEDLSDLYLQYMSGSMLHLPLKTDSFRYWQQQQQQYVHSAVLKKEEAYWSAVESIGLPALPMDNINGGNQVKVAASRSFALDEATTTKLLTQCYKAFNTDINDILLATLSLAVHEIFNTTTVGVKLEGHGREDIGGDIDVTRTVGWFTTMYPVVFDMYYHSDPLRHLIAVKEVLHRVPGKGIGYGILRYAGARPYCLAPQILFNYLGDFGHAVGTGNSSAVFSFSGAYRGNEVSADRERGVLLEVSGIVMKGCLQMSVEYSSQQYNVTTINALIAAYHRHLAALITRLSATTNKVLTPVDLTYKDLSIDQVIQLQQQIPLEDVYKLSPLQEGLYFHWAATPGSPMYFEQVSYRLKGALNMALLEKSYYMLIARHAVLRTHFTQRFGERILQVVAQSVKEGFTYEQISSNVDHQIEQIKQQDRARGFDLNKGSQMRLTVLDVGGDNWEFIWSHHHIIMDGWCIGILVKEFFYIYDSLLGGQEPVLMPVHSYAKYIQWLESINRNDMLRYWRDYLSGYDTVSTLPQKRDTIRRQAVVKRRSFHIGGLARKKITTLCAELRITENIFIQAVWGILLSAYNARNDVVFGAVVSGRAGHLEGIEDMIGFFINTIPVRIQYDNLLTIRSLLLGIKESLVLGELYHYTQLVDIQEESGFGKHLFNNILIFENYPVQEIIKRDLKEKSVWEDLSFTSKGGYEQTNFDFVVVVSPGITFNIDFCYNANIYEESLVERLQQLLVYIAEAMLKEPDGLVSAINYPGTGDSASKDETAFSAVISDNF
ncbi:amino acid adenylation domain-containing protein/non-ribosomal peptide synthase protein (TIGR01720 family) [Chitinophaga sp. W2I13]|uniref:amino acid adenylation domain-containing protein n=1 Tax=Chitinophaga sp. W2I13 TaxID=3373923 RepID=UPI003D1B2A4C